MSLINNMIQKLRDQMRGKNMSIHTSSIGFQKKTRQPMYRLLRDLHITESSNVLVKNLSKVCSSLFVSIKTLSNLWRDACVFNTTCSKFPSAKFLSLIFICKNRINVIVNLNGLLLATCKTFSLRFNFFFSCLYI